MIKSLNIGDWIEGLQYHSDDGYQIVHNIT
jgi:hypothetical protein